MSIKSVSVLVAAIVWNCVSLAQNNIKENANFQSEISQFSARCEEENCEKPFSRKEIYDQSKNQNINQELKKKYFNEFHSNRHRSGAIPFLRATTRPQETLA